MNHLVQIEKFYLSQMEAKRGMLEDYEANHDAVNERIKNLTFTEMDKIARFIDDEYIQIYPKFDEESGEYIVCLDILIKPEGSINIDFVDALFMAIGYYFSEVEVSEEQENLIDAAKDRFEAYLFDRLGSFGAVGDLLQKARMEMERVGREADDVSHSSETQKIKFPK